MWTKELQVALRARADLSQSELAQLVAFYMRGHSTGKRVIKRTLNAIQYSPYKAEISEDLLEVLLTLNQSIKSLPDKTFNWQELESFVETRGYSVVEVAKLATAQLRQMGYADEITKGGINNYKGGKWGIPRRLQVALALIAEQRPALPEKTFSWQELESFSETRGYRMTEVAELATAQLRQMGYADEITRSGINNYKGGKHDIPKRLQVALWRVRQFTEVIDLRNYIQLLSECSFRNVPDKPISLKIGKFVPLRILGNIVSR